jgi:shikimate dehydrogenase
MELEGGDIALVGSGGAARAILAALSGHRVYLLGRSPSAVQKLAADFNQRLTVIPLAPLPRRFACDWLINATSVSSSRESLELAAWAETLRPRRGVMDINYGRPDNFWRELAERRHLPFQDGRSMLAFQARDSFQLWTGQDPGIEIFKQSLQL